MRDPNRIPDVLNALKELWEFVPDWRLMQLLCNLQSSLGGDGFYLEDEQFMEYIKTWVERMKKDETNST